MPWRRRKRVAPAQKAEDRKRRDFETFGAGSALDFIPKTDLKGQPMPRTESVPPNSEIVGVAPLNTQRLLNQAQGAIPNAQDALVKFSATMSRFDAVGPKAEKALDEIAAFARLARELVPELRETNKRVQDFIGADGPPDPKNQDIAFRRADEPEPANRKSSPSGL